jgi:hypothetical protein
MDPLIIILSALGLYFFTHKLSRIWRLTIVGICSGLLFLEYLPHSFNRTADLYKDSPSIYHQLAADNSVKTVAEYPLTDMALQPTVFTFQPVYDKPLLNANSSDIERGPLDTSIGGLNDTQTIGALKAIGIDVITLHGQPVANSLLKPYAPPSAHNEGGIAPIYSYRIKPDAPERDNILMASSGFRDFSVDEKQISHRVMLATSTITVKKLKPSSRSTFLAGMTAQPLCGKPADFKAAQNGNVIWSGVIPVANLTLNFTVSGDAPIKLYSSCALDITNMYAN